MERGTIIDALVLRDCQGVGDRAFKVLVDGLGSPGAVLGAGPVERAETCGVSPHLAAAIDTFAFRAKPRMPLSIKTAQRN